MTPQIRNILAEMLVLERTRLPLWLPVALGLGIALYFVQAEPTPIWPYAASLTVAAMLLGILWSYHGMRLVLTVLIALLLGASVAAMRLQSVAAPVLHEPVFFKSVEGTVEDIQHREKKVKLILSDPKVETLAAESTPLRLSVTLKQLETPLAIGDRVRLPSMLFSPPAPAMPGSYDFARMFYFEQLGAVGFSPRQPERLAGAAENSLKDGLTSLRLSIADHLIEAMGPTAGAIASALIVGEQSRVPEEIADSMRASGLYHILSISGLHMALATGLIFFVARLILAAIPYTALHWPNKKIAAVAGLIGGAAYLLLAGSPVPAIRSYIMVACVLGAILVDRKGISMYSLAWAAAIILLIMPESLFTASFQLSFAATIAIVALYERFGHVFFASHASFPKRVLLYFVGLMLTSLAATLYTSPLAITHFNRMAIYGILANMLVVPLSSFWIMPMAMLALLAMPLGLDHWPLVGLKWGIDLMVQGSNFVSRFPYANITLPSPSDAGFVLIVAGGLWFALFVSRLRFAGLLMMVLGLSTIALFKPYDFIISDDAKRVAYRSVSGEWVMLRGNVGSFEAESWLRMQGADTILSRTQAKNAIEELMCDKTTCMVVKNGQTAVVQLRKDESLDLCESGADIVVSDRYMHCDNITTTIDNLFVSIYGSTALRLEGDDVHVTTAQESRGLWPWVEKVRLVEDEDAAMMGQNEE